MLSIVACRPGSSQGNTFSAILKLLVISITNTGTLVSAARSPSLRTV